MRFAATRLTTSYMGNAGPQDAVNAVNRIVRD
jgi:hypothetical protein